MKTIAAPTRQQRGMALIVSLVILLSMTLLGLAAIQNTSLEERMAGNIRAENIAFQAAEAALRAGEQVVNNFQARPDTGSPPTTNQVWTRGTNVGTSANWWFAWTDAEWKSSWAQSLLDGDLEYVAGTDVSGAAAFLTGSQAPRFVIEEYDYDTAEALVVGTQRDQQSRRVKYRITARGLDSAGRSEVMLSSIFARRF
jgi:type IV pilus assembly protein PilX